MDSLTALKRVVAQLETTLQATQRQASASEELTRLAGLKNATCEEEKRAMQSIITGKNNIISNQESTIKKLGTRPKFWTLSAVAGYGFGLSTEAKRMPFVGIALGRTLLRF